MGQLNITKSNTSSICIKCRCQHLQMLIRLVPDTFGHLTKCLPIHMKYKKTILIIKSHFLIDMNVSCTITLKIPRSYSMCFHIFSFAVK